MKEPWKNPNWYSLRMKKAKLGAYKMKYICSRKSISWTHSVFNPFFWCHMGKANPSRVGSHVPRQSFYRHQWWINSTTCSVGRFWTNRWKPSQKNYHWCRSADRRNACRKSGKGQQYEVQVSHIEILGESDPDQIPFNRKTQLWIFERACAPAFEPPPFLLWCEFALPYLLPFMIILEKKGFTMCIHPLLR